MLKAFFSPHGRRRRLTYWRAFALVGVFGLVASPALAIAMAVVNAWLDQPPFLEFAVYVLLAGILGLSLWAGVALAIQRLHDRDHSGWWVLIALVPVIGSIWYLLWNGLIPGTPGTNRFGPDPRAPYAAALAAFDDDRPAVPRERKPVFSTLVTVLLFFVVLVLNVVLFQGPPRRPPGPAAPPTAPISR